MNTRNEKKYIFFRDPMLSELIRTVKVRLDQIEEDELDVRNNIDSSEESDDNEDDSADEMLESDGENADISEDEDDDDEYNSTDANDSGICVSD